MVRDAWAGRAEAAEDRVTELEDLLYRLKVSALHGLGGTPDYWIGEIDDALAKEDTDE